MKIFRPMMIGFLAVTAAAAQAVLNDPKKIEDARWVLDTLHGGRLRCEVFPTRTRFNFSLRLQSGYYWRLHLSPSQLAGQKWIVLVQVTPKSGNRSPAYLSDVIQFPNDGDIGPQTRMGHFWVGEGRYAVKFLMFNDSGRACRGEWQLDAHLGSSERKIDPLLAPNSVAGISWNVATHAAGSMLEKVKRLTILLDVADQTRTADQVLLMDALTALIDELQARSVRLVLFDLTQQKEVFRRDVFTSEALPAVTKAMGAVQYEPVNVGVLQNPAGGVALIENLANLEIHSPERSDAVVFLGIPSIYKSKPSAYFGQPPGAKPQFFYLLCPAWQAPRSYPGGPMADVQGDVGRNFPEPVGGTAGPSGSLPARFPSPRSRSQSRGPDSIAYAVNQLGGKTLNADSPDAFAKAVAEIKRAMGDGK
jgi:hypothetical protein